MRLTWNEIRARAADFARDWDDATYEKGETQSFYDAFFDVFGIQRRAVGSFERAVKKLGGGQGFIDLFWPGVMLVEQKSAGRDLGRAEFQAMDYIHALKKAERPRYVLLSDFQTFRLIDLAEREEVEFALAELPKHVQRFGFMLGVERRTFKDQDPVNIKAAELVGRLHDALEAGGFTGTDLEVFLVRIVFCLFADDTGVFEERDIFLRWLKERTAEDGSDLGPKLALLFQTLDTAKPDRPVHLDESLNAFPHVNGELFKGATSIPAFNSDMRLRLIEACEFDWTPISPAIFGSLFQSVMDSEERRKSGAHYTTEKNIMKVIEPLFLDDLRAELEAATAKTRGREQALHRLSDKLGSLTFFDPACGCGNFLIIAYRELRRLEIDLLKARFADVFNRPGFTVTEFDFDVRSLVKVDVDQFYGIEIGEFAAKIAETAMWMMDHIMNNELSLEFGKPYARIPLVKAATIVCGDALEVEWEDVLPAEQCDYVLGNPPFVGKKEQDRAQKAQVRRIFAGMNGAGEIDYVACWFAKGSEYIASTSDTRLAFVSTNSLVQGQQVALFWKSTVVAHELELAFAHRPFVWRSEGRHPAQVHVVIIGLTKRGTSKTKYIYDYTLDSEEPTQILAKNINAYILDYDDVFISSSRKAPCVVPKIQKGNEATDWGFLTLEGDERIEAEKAGVNPRWIRPYWGGRRIYQQHSSLLPLAP